MAMLAKDNILFEIVLMVHTPCLFHQTLYLLFHFYVFEGFSAECNANYRNRNVSKVVDGTVQCRISDCEEFQTLSGRAAKDVS